MTKELFTPQVKKAVANLSQKMGKPPAYFERKARQAIREMLEDEADYFEAFKRSQDPNRELLTLEEFKKEIALDT